MGATVVHAGDVEAAHGVFHALTEPLGVGGFRVNHHRLGARGGCTPRGAPHAHLRHPRLI